MGPGIVTRMAVGIVVIGVLAGCSSDATSEIVDAAREAANGAACSVLASIGDELATASQDGGTNLASKAESLADGLNNAAGGLEAAGAGDAADQLRALADDLNDIATSAPGDIQAKASDAADRVDSASSSLDCPA